MFRNLRLLIGLCALTGISIAGIVGWATGMFGRIAYHVSATWESLITWLDQPVTSTHMFAGAGAILVPLLILLAVILVLTDR